MARRLARWTVWVIKAALAAVALAALVAWPWSYGHPAWVNGRRVVTSTQGMDATGVDCWWRAGRIGANCGMDTWTQEGLADRRRLGVQDAEGWTWQTYPKATPGNLRFSCGPLRWDRESDSGEGFSYVTYCFSLPCWLLALAAGAWPAGSAVLFVRRRRRAARRARGNCCRRCGYDLRATPAADGAMLAVCPECGMAAAR